MSDLRKFNVTLDALVLLRVSNVVAPDAAAAYARAVEIVGTAQLDSAADCVARGVSGVEWSQFGDHFDGAIVDVVGDEGYNLTVRLDEFGNKIPAPELGFHGNPLISKALDVVKMQMDQMDQTDWLYRKLSGILMELRDTGAVLNLRHDEKPNPN